METLHSSVRKLSEEEVLALVDRNSVARLGVADKGEVYVVPVTYVRDGSFLYCHSRWGKKLEMMNRNPSVCLEVDEIESLFKWKSVVIEGDFEMLDDLESARGMRLLLMRISLAQSNHGLTPLELEISAMLERSVIYRIHIRGVSGRAEGD